MPILKDTVSVSDDHGIETVHKQCLGKRRVVIAAGNPSTDGKPSLACPVCGKEFETQEEPKKISRLVGPGTKKRGVSGDRLEHLKRFG